MNQVRIPIGFSVVTNWIFLVNPLSEWFGAMPVSKKYVGWFAGGAVCVVSAWVALIVGSVTTNVLVPSKVVASSAKSGPGSVGTGLAGPSAEHVQTRAETAPTFTHLRLSQVTQRGLFAGRGEPNGRVVLLQAGRAVADVRADENGIWQIATAMPRIAGDHVFAVEQKGADGDFVVGESIRVHVPEAFRQTVNVTGEPASRGFQLVAAQTDREDLGTASSRKFDELMREGVIKQDPVKSRGVVAELSDDLLAPAWDWIRDANRSYLDEVVPRIKRGGGYGQGKAGDRAREPSRTARRAPERVREDGAGWSRETASWVPSGVADWLAAAQRGYTTEIVPRLSGRVPAVIVARKPDDEADRETEAERRRRLERERNVEESATERAEQERLEAARQRRAAERRRQEAEEEARRLAEARRQADLEEARKLAAERRRVLERRAQEKRQAEAAERQREKDAEEQRRLNRERELARAQEAAEREALERQRRADQEREAKETAAERERKRLAELDLRTREQEREAAEQRRLAEQERRDRLIAEAAAIKQRQEEARRRAREQEAAQREEARRLQRARIDEERRLARERREQRRLEARRQEEQRRAQRRQEQQRLEARRAEERRQRLARAAELNRAAARERREAERQRNRQSGSNAPTRRVAQPRLRDLNRFSRRNTEIEIKVIGEAATGTAGANRRDDRPRAKAKAKRRVASLRRAKRTRKPRTTKARRKAVRGYRRRLARTNRKRSRCHRTAGRRINPPGTYTVKRGDSLWRISKRHYRLGRYFRTIHRANKRKIRLARLIYPCQRFYLPRRRRS